MLQRVIWSDFNLTNKRKAKTMCEDKYKQIEELRREVQLLTASNRELRETVQKLQRELDEAREASETEGWTK